MGGSFYGNIVRSCVTSHNFTTNDAYSDLFCSAYEMRPHLKTYATKYLCVSVPIFCGPQSTLFVCLTHQLEAHRRRFSSTSCCLCLPSVFSALTVQHSFPSCPTLLLVSFALRKDSVATAVVRKGFTRLLTVVSSSSIYSCRNFVTVVIELLIRFQHR